jgi:folate-binding protein YgfZ
MDGMARHGDEAARQSAVVTVRTDSAPVFVRGADRVSWLQGLLTNDVAALRPGQGCYAAYLTPQGRMICDLRVLVLETAVLLDLPAAVREAVIQRLETFIITEDVHLDDASSTLARVSICGPKAVVVAARALADLGRSAAVPGLPAVSQSSELTTCLSSMAEHDHLREAARDAGPEQGVLVAATWDIGEHGFDFYVPAASTEAVRNAIEHAGAVLIDAKTWDLLRVEAGRPRFGVDMDADTIPLEAGIEDRAISFTKGCYVGQEVIVRVRDRGHGRVARRLVGLVPVKADAWPGYPLGRGTVLQANGADIGRLTSVAYSSRRGSTIALGMVHRDFVDPGTIVTAAGEEGEVALAVTPTPLVTIGATV